MHERPLPNTLRRTSQHRFCFTFRDTFRPSAGGDGGGKGKDRVMRPPGPGPSPTPTPTQQHLSELHSEQQQASTCRRCRDAVAAAGNDGGHCDTTRPRPCDESKSTLAWLRLSRGDRARRCGHAQNWTTSERRRRHAFAMPQASTSRNKAEKVAPWARPVQDAGEGLQKFSKKCTSGRERLQVQRENRLVQDGRGDGREERRGAEQGK
mmetsp:Transcript_25781/g.44394  ORF Transcript_25781/g.44394 Transcript_25781/m.44394 type:complete len:208 (-) Transcript_25781:972-1595(-)